MPIIEPNDPAWKKIGYLPEKCASKGLNNLIGNALVNKTFRELLLDKPDKALEVVSAKEKQTFGDQLTKKEKLLVLEHSVGTLRAFAEYILDNLQNTS